MYSNLIAALREEVIGMVASQGQNTLLGSKLVKKYAS